MKKFRFTGFYSAIILGFFALIYLFIKAGEKLETFEPPKAALTVDPVHTIQSALSEPLSLLLAQIIIILIVARILGSLMRKIKQPAVIGEMIAGIILGPSLAGKYLPGFSDSIFPASSLMNIQYLSQIGLILFMFIVGMELDLSKIKQKSRQAVVISHVSIAFPFLLGVGFAYFTYLQLATAGTRFISFALFMGIAMSITAFPVLARIVRERGLSGTALGSLVISCAAADDVSAWCILAAVVAIVKGGSGWTPVFILMMAMAYVLIMIFIIKPLLEKLSKNFKAESELPVKLVSVSLFVIMLSAYCTEVIGIHALFGAFVAGAIMPASDRLREKIREKIEDVALVLLLPLFFVLTGLKTHINLLSDPFMFMMTVIVVIIAVLGKFAGSAIAARFVGETWQTSLSVGALMNTRGLMELIVLNIGYDLGILSTEVFSMMVLMALLTTFMTGPALNLIGKYYTQRQKIISEPVKYS